jgi:hypothetical protein
MNLPNWLKLFAPLFSGSVWDCAVILVDALVRKQLWKLKTFQMSQVETESIKIPKQLFNTWANLLCYAA